MQTLRFILIILLLNLCCASAWAGRISGKVSDEQTGQGVIGATVVVKGSSTGTVTDVDGQFSLEVAAGNYTLEVKYLGYQTREITDVLVTEAEPAIVNVLISEAASTQLGEVVVRSTLKKENISALYVLQRNNVAVSSGISADLIRRSPDRNTGEVLKRVSGTSTQNGRFVIIRGLSERYNAAMLNGAQMQSTEPDKKAFSYDVIPSNLIDHILINKTASADMPGDFAGGVVQVHTKDVPDQSFLHGGLSLGYNTQSTGRDFIANRRATADLPVFSAGDGALPSSFQTPAAYKELVARDREKAAAVARQLGNPYPEIRSIALPNGTLQFAAGDARSIGTGKLGMVAGLVYRNAQSILPDFERSTWDAQGNFNSGSRETSYRSSSSMAALANISYVKAGTRLTFRNLYNAMSDLTYYRREGMSFSSAQQFRLYSSIPNNRNLYSGQLEGSHLLGSNEAKLYWNLNFSSLTASQPDLRTLYYSRTGTVTDYQLHTDESEPFGIVDRNSRRFFTQLNDQSRGGNMYVQLPFTVWERKQSLKAGYLGVYKQRSFSARTFEYELEGDLNNGISRLPVAEVLATEHISPEGFTLREITSNDDAYEAGSVLHAGFVMLDNRLGGRLRLSWGARFESYTQQLSSILRSGQVLNKTDVFNDLLPSFNLSYELNNQSKLRLSGSRTVNRPEFREIAPFQFIDFENNWTLIGNDSLNRANISNIDLRYEYYPGSGEVITVGAFYKHFDNPIENRMNDQSNYDLLIFGYKNARSASSYGLEVELRKNLSFMGPALWLERMVLGANFTYIHSRVDLSNFGIRRERPLQGQSPYLVNLSMLYNDPRTGLGVSALFNRIGERVFIVGKDDMPNIWEKARNVIDLQLSKSILQSKGELKLTISDLLNQPYLFYWNFDERNTYNAAADRVFQKYTPGTTYTLGFTYRLGK